MTVTVVPRPDVVLDVDLNAEVACMATVPCSRPAEWSAQALPCHHIHNACSRHRAMAEVAIATKRPLCNVCHQSVAGLTDWRHL